MMLPQTGCQKVFDKETIIAMTIALEQSEDSSEGKDNFDSDCLTTTLQGLRSLRMKTGKLQKGVGARIRCGDAAVFLF
jgi:hypothetical protein